MAAEIFTRPVLSPDVRDLLSPDAVIVCHRCGAEHRANEECLGAGVAAFGRPASGALDRTAPATNDGGMTDAQHRAISAYLRTLADALLLRDWEIVLERAWCDSGSYATVNVWGCENHARVRVCEGFAAYAATERREWLTHELLHAVLDRPDRVMQQLAEQWDENSACQFARKAHAQEIEVCVQKLARIIAPFMPLPPEAP